MFTRKDRVPERIEIAGLPGDVFHGVDSGCIGKLLPPSGHVPPGREDARARSYGRASRIILNGGAATRRKRVKPACRAPSRSLASPACARSADPTAWSSDAGVHTRVDAS